MPWAFVALSTSSKIGMPNVFPKFPACAMIPFERTWVWAVVFNWGTAAKVALWITPITAKRAIQIVVIGRVVKDSNVMKVARMNPVIAKETAVKRDNNIGIKTSDAMMLINGRIPIRDVDCPVGNVSGMMANRATKVAV